MQQLFLSEERLTLDGHAFTVRSAQTIGAHLRRSARIARGNLELPDELQRASDASGSDRTGSLLRRVATRPGLWPSFAVYAITSTLPKAAARRLIADRREPAWARDDSSRAIA